MFCIHCGNRLSEDARFCGNCGQKVMPPELSKEVAAAENAAAQPVVTEPEEVNPAAEEPVTETPVISEPEIAAPAAARVPAAAASVSGPSVPAGGAQAGKKKKKKKHTGLKVVLWLLLILVVVYGVFAVLFTFDILEPDLPDSVSKFIDFDYLLPDKSDSDTLSGEDEEAFLKLVGYWDEACLDEKERKFEKAFPDYAEEYVLKAYNANSVEELLSYMHDEYFSACGDDAELSESCRITMTVSEDELSGLARKIKKQCGERVSLVKAYVIENTTKAEGEDGTVKYTDLYLFYQDEEGDWAILPLVGDDALSDFGLTD